MILLVNIPKTEKTLLDFFSISKKSKKQQSILKIEDDFSNINKPKLMKNAKKKGAKHINLRKKKPVFRLPKLTKDISQRILQKQSLAYGLLSKKISFDDDQCFSNPLCPPSKNDASLEANLQVLIDFISNNMVFY